LRTAFSISLPAPQGARADPGQEVQIAGTFTVEQSLEMATFCAPADYRDASSSIGTGPIERSDLRGIFQRLGY
jgi:hypothetical protein